MSNKENMPPTPSRTGFLAPETQNTPSPGSVSFTLGLRPWQTTAFTSPPIRAISPSSKPDLDAQRHHSDCRRSDTPLKIRKTRENLREPFPTIPPPCCHEVNDLCEHVDDQIPPSDHSLNDTITPLLLPTEKPPTRMQRQKSMSRRMLSKVKEGLTSRSKVSSSGKAMDPDGGLIRRLSGRRKQSLDVQCRASSFEVSRDSFVTVSDFDPKDIYVMREAMPCSSIVQERICSTEAGENIPWTLSCPTISPPCEERCSTVDISVGDASLPVSKGNQTATDRSTCTISIPHVALSLHQDQSMVDARTTRYVWIAAEASVLSRVYNASSSQLCTQEAVTANTEHASNASSNSENFGTITSLRLSFKVVGGCTIAETIGQKGMRDLSHGERCLFFLRVHVPKMQCPSQAPDNDADAMFTELESMIGTLEMEILHVEARYRISIQPHDNFITCRQVARIRRPRLDSRWSALALIDDAENREQVHTRLATYIADSYPPEQALQYIQQCLEKEGLEEKPLRQIWRRIEDELAIQEANGRPQSTQGRSEHAKPAVIVTCIDGDVGSGNAPTTCDSGSWSANYSASVEPPTALQSYALHARTRSTSLSNTINSSNADLRSPEPRRTVLAEQHQAANETQDAARKVWHHIRRTSLSSNQLMITPITADIERLETGDEHLKALRSKALANKRSIGAETLKGWQWDCEVGRAGNGEAPWL